MTSLEVLLNFIYEIEVDNKDNLLSKQKYIEVNSMGLTG
jgi:hypothetical protein